MELYDVYSRLRNDIIHSKYSKAYFINQENDINVLNTHQKRGWRHFLDAYQVTMNGNSLFGSFIYDKEAGICKPLIFQSFSKQSGLDFLNFINSIITGDEKVFLHVECLEVFDLRKALFEVKELVINNTEVDSFLVSMLERYLPKLEQIRFNNCIIKKGCCFFKIKSNIEFNGSIIEDFRVFNDTEAKIEFLRTKIEKISNTSVNSKTIKFQCINNLNYKELFLKCNFKKLESLIISPDKDKVGISYGNNFMFLPKSTPNLENLSIEGKLASFDFLVNMRNLLRCNISSIYDIHSSLYPDVITRVEREKLKKRNIETYNVKKILNPDKEDRFIIGTIELARIMRLARFNKLLDYSEEEQKFLLENPNLIEYLISQKVGDIEVMKFYESYFDTLILRNTENEEDVRLGLEDTYRLQKGILYKDRTCKRLNDNKRIVLCKTFIYNYDNKPIIFMNRPKPVRTEQDAIDFRKKYEYRKGFIEEDLNRYDYNKFIDLLKELKDSEEKISIGNLIDAISEEASYNVKVEDFRKLGEGGRYIAGVLECLNRSEERFNSLHTKNTYYRSLIKKLILDNYDKFTISEKIVLFFDNEKYEIFSNRLAITLDIYGIEKDYDKSLIKSIDLKTNNLYSKYMNMVKLTYEQTSIQHITYNLPVKKEYIKKLELKQ